jgi:hypothetical protein
MATQPTNLTMHREGPSVWDRQARECSKSRTLGMIGFLMIAGGTCLLAQAYRRPLSSALRMRIGPLFEGRKRDNVHQASKDSFPASDPPSWTHGVGNPSEAENRLQ